MITVATAFPASGPSALRRFVISAVVTVTATVVMAGCAVTVPSHVRPVENFDVKRYVGTWYELARIDNRFEKGLINATAEYSLNADGTVKVVNRGFNREKNEWKEVTGKAKLLGDPRTAALRVTFFGPFYGGYNVVYLSEDYGTAIVIGDSMDYFWLLSREKVILEPKRKALMAEAERIGVDLSKVIDVTQR